MIFTVHRKKWAGRGNTTAGGFAERHSCIGAVRWMGVGTEVWAQHESVGCGIRGIGIKDGSLPRCERRPQIMAQQGEAPRLARQVRRVQPSTGADEHQWRHKIGSGAAVVVVQVQPPASPPA